MNSPFRLWATILVVIFFSSCNRSKVSLEYTNAKDEVALLENFEFRFSSALVKDSLLNQWDSTEYISFEPKIAGRFRWERPDQLVFSPAGPLLPATSYKAVLNNSLLQFSKYSSISGDLKFHTPDLKLDHSEASWVQDESSGRGAKPQVTLFFNYPVQPNSLKDKLHLSAKGKPASYSINTLSPSNRIIVQLDQLPLADEDLEAKITLDAGLLPEGGSEGMKAKTESTAFLSSPYTLRINDVSTDPEGSVFVSTSQQVESGKLASYIKIDPSVTFTVEQTDDGFVIRSDNFSPSKSYDLSIAKGLRGKIGGVLKDEYSTSLAFGQMEPSISFQNSKGIYLSKLGEKNLEIKITNVEKVKLVVSKIYENNLLASQQTVYYPDNDEEGYRRNDASVEPTIGDIIYAKVVETKSLPKAGNSRLLHFSIEDKLNDFKGIYHVMVRSTNDNWVRDSRFVSLSDMGLIAKEGRDKMVVFVNSIKTANPMDGVNIVAYGANNQVLGLGSTNAEGVAEISYARREFAGFRPAFVVAKTADDFNYIPFASTKVNTSRFEVGGKKSNASGLDAYIYGERDIYRPGEKINFSVILRDNQWKSPGEIPVQLKFLLPNGKELKSFRRTLNTEGSLEGTLDVAATAITGTYNLEIYSSNDVLLGTHGFHIEEFVPDRIKVVSKLDKPFLRPGDATELSIHADNFFGPPASDRNVECEIQIKQKSFEPKKYGTYNFDLANQTDFSDKTVRQAKTNQAGEVSEHYQVPAEFANLGLLQANFYTTVFDETGRPVSSLTSANIYTQPVFFGIRSDGYDYYDINTPVKFPVIALDKDEKVMNEVQAEVKVIKHEYKTVLARAGSYFRYESQKEDRTVISSNVDVSGEQTTYSFTPRIPGEYELRVYIPGSNSYVSKPFYSYGSWGIDASSFEVSNEGNIDIETDKSAYAVGGKVKALFKTPFSGRMLVTLETDKIISYQYINVDQRTASVELPLPADAVPNAFITATIFKPHDVSDIPLTVAHGFQNIEVIQPDAKSSVEIVAEKSVRSHTHQKIRVKTEPNSMVTLAAVDNGILQITNFQTPDPYKYFYANRALEVNAYDIYPLLLPEIRNRMSSTGGDMESAMKKRTNPMTSKRFRLMSYWSGIKQADGSGEAEFEFDVPQFSGEIRLMAVSYKGQHFGAGEENMKVADPLVISSALPRFLSPRDSVSMVVTLTNTTTRSMDATANLKISGPLDAGGNTRINAEIPANSEKKITFGLMAQPAIGTANVNIEVAAAGEHYTDETEIAVRPPASLQKIYSSGSVPAGTSQAVRLGANDFIPSSLDYSLMVSRSPAMELAQYLNRLVIYPFGCTEQTVSIAFPQIYYGDMADMLKSGKAAKAGANYDVQEAIRKIKMRQLYNGGVMLWDSEDTEDWWATIYAAHFLIEAKKAGFDVDKSLLETMLNYINRKLNRRETITYFYNRTLQKKIAPKEVAYSLYVLALAGTPNVSVMNYYKARPEWLSLDCKYLLSAAYALSGDKASFKQFLPNSFSGEVSVAQTGGSFYSDVRDESIALDVLMDVDPGNPQVPVMAEHVVSMLKNRVWYSTQELSFSFIALGKLYRSIAKTNATAQILVGNKPVASMTGADLRLTRKDLNGTDVQVAVRGSGRLYYCWQAEGISASGKYTEEDSYLRVRRHFYDRYGRPISENTFKQNDLVIVKLTIDKSFDGRIDNVVITDMLPAGFEIENPRTKDIPGMDWIKDESKPTALDVRDDRINLFVNVYSNHPQVYYYAVRAVSPGVYKMGPVSADAMYNGEYHSYNGAGVIKVVP